ncbi:MAG: hypothetical protein ACK4UN_05530 [Limisphaerales bacterium]
MSSFLLSQTSEKGFFSPLAKLQANRKGIFRGLVDVQTSKIVFFDRLARDQAIEKAFFESLANVQTVEKGFFKGLATLQTTKKAIFDRLERSQGRKKAFFGGLATLFRNRTTHRSQVELSAIIRLSFQPQEGGSRDFVMIESFTVTLLKSFFCNKSRCKPLDSPNPGNRSHFQANQAIGTAVAKCQI